MQNRKLLSICIPTYNRGKYLKQCLQSVFVQIEDKSDVEVVVNDNNSTDNTLDILNSFSGRPNFMYHVNTENVGMSNNILTVVSKAKGEFCWLIGDDDFIITGAIDEILKQIKINNDVDFFYVKPTGLSIEEFESIPDFDSTKSPLKVPAEYSKVIIEDWQELIRPKFSLIFMGELMASVFRRDIWMQYQPVVKGEFLSDLANSYVFAVVYANTFKGKKTMFLDTPMIMAFSGARDWWDKLGYVLIELVRDLLLMYKEKGFKKQIISECFTQYFFITLPYIIKYMFVSSPNRKRISFARYGKLIASYPIAFMSGMFRFIFHIIKNVVSKILLKISPSFHTKIKNKSIS